MESSVGNLELFKTEIDIKEEDMNQSITPETCSDIELGKYECLISQEEEDAANPLASIKIEPLEEPMELGNCKTPDPSDVGDNQHTITTIFVKGEPFEDLEDTDSYADFGRSSPESQEHIRRSPATDGFGLGHNDHSSEQSGAAPDGGPSSGPRVHHCNLCPSRFNRADHLKKHQSVHTGEKPYQCETCPSRFARAHHLKQHMLSHSGEKNHQCTVCLGRFNRAGELRRHMMVHSGVKAHRCDLCAFRTNDPRSLKRHHLIHSGLKPHKCTLCAYSSNDVGNLRVHIRQHSQDRPYRCTECPSRFYEARHLETHVRATHRGIKPYDCAYCVTSFSRASSLKRHMLVHSKAKRFECDKCEYKTKLTHHLEEHKVRRHGGEKPFGCAHCKYRAVVKQDLVRHLSRKHR